MARCYAHPVVRDYMQLSELSQSTISASTVEDSHTTDHRVNLSSDMQSPSLVSGSSNDVDMWATSGLHPMQSPIRCVNSAWSTPSTEVSMPRQWMSDLGNSPMPEFSP